MPKRTRNNCATGTTEPTHPKQGKQASKFEGLDLISPSLYPCIPAVVAALGLNLKISLSTTNNESTLCLQLANQSMRWQLLPKLKYAIREKQKQPKDNNLWLTPLLAAISQCTLTAYKLTSQDGYTPKNSATNTLYFFSKLHKLALTPSIQRTIQRNFAQENKKSNLLLAWPIFNKKLLQNPFIHRIFHKYDLELCYLYHIVASELNTPSRSKEREDVGSWFLNSRITFYTDATFEDNEDLCFFYLKSARTIIAYFALSETLEELTYFYVSKERQGQGIGSLLFMIITNIMLAYEIPSIKLESTPTPQANRFYSGFGLTPYTYNNDREIQSIEPDDLDMDCSHLYRGELPLDKSIMKKKKAKIEATLGKNKNHQPSLFQAHHASESKTEGIASPKY